MAITKEILKSFKKEVSKEITDPEKAKAVEKLKKALQDKSFDTIDIGLK